MQKKLLIASALMAVSLQMDAQTTIAADYKGTANGNPISANTFCADPTVLYR